MYALLGTHPALKRFAETREASSHEKMMAEGVVRRAIAHARENRYSNIFPFDENLVRGARDDDDYYLNASWCDFSKSDSPRRHDRFIIAAGPMCPEYHGPDTRDAFWEAIVANGVRIVVCLARFQPGFSGCCDYLGIMARGGEGDAPASLNLQRHEIRTRAVTRNDVAGFTVRELEISSTRDGGVKSDVRHYYFERWPNYSIPDLEEEKDRPSVTARSGVDDVADLLEAVERDHESAPTRPILVHCSGGIGRSGTFVGAMQTWRDLRNTRATDDVNLREAIERRMFENTVTMRIARHPWMVEGEEQFDFALAVVRAALMRSALR